MKRILAQILLSLFLSIISPIGILADTQIRLEEYGGVYRLPCTVNGAKMKFIFDTGASNVCLSLSMAEYLYDNDYITSKDIVGSGSSTVADGRLVDHVVLNLKDIEIGGQHLRNVRAVVIDGQNAPLLMGQSALRKLGTYTINGNYLVLKEKFSHSNNYDNIDVGKLFETAYDALMHEDYRESTNIYSYLYNKNLLSPYGKLLFAESLSYNKEFHNSLDIISEIEEDLIIDFPEKEYRLYEIKGHCLRELSDFESAISCYTKSIRNLPLEHKWRKEEVRLTFLLSRCFVEMGDYYRAERTMNNYLQRYTSFFDISPIDCWNKKYKDELLGIIYYYLALNLDLNQPGQSRVYDKYMIISAAWGHSDAKETCKQYNLTFDKKPYEYEY